MIQDKTLIIIDIQNDYFESGRNTLENAIDAASNASLVLKKFRLEGFPIFHIQHTNIRPGATFFLPNTPGIEIHEFVRPSANEKVISKNFPNSFRNTPLLKELQSLNITDLIICGMMTHMCVDATTRAAKDFGFNCTLIGDACATKKLDINGNFVEAKDVHNAFLAALNYFYASVVTTKQYLS